MKLAKKYKYIIFDFDGTINDTSAGIYATFTEVLAHFGVDASKLDLSRHIGPPLEDSYMRLLGKQRCAQAIELHKEVFYRTNAAANSRLYDGIMDVLSELKKNGFVLAVATSKYEPHVLYSLRCKGLQGYFDQVYGQTEKRGFKRDVIRQLIEDNNWDKSLCLMIGDTPHDIKGAHACQIDAVAVTYGFGHADELAACFPIATVDSPEKILELLL